MKLGMWFGDGCTFVASNRQGVRFIVSNKVIEFHGFDPIRDTIVVDGEGLKQISKFDYLN